MVHSEPTSLFRSAKVISSAKNQQVSTIHSYHLEEVPVWKPEVWCESLSQHSSGHHKLRKPWHALRPFLWPTVLPWGERFGRIPSSNRLREDWVGPACPTGIKYYLYNSSHHSCCIPRYVKQISSLFNKYVLNVCCGPGTLPGVQRWNVWVTSSVGRQTNKLRIQYNMFCINPRGMSRESVEGKLLVCLKKENISWGGKILKWTWVTVSEIGIGQANQGRSRGIPPRRRVYHKVKGLGGFGMVWEGG